LLATAFAFLALGSLSACNQHPAVATPPQETAWTWGYNDKGQLGYATNNPNQTSATPTEVPSLGPGVRTVGAGQWHTIVLRFDGSVWDWGDNSRGQLGNGTTSATSGLVSVSGLGSGVVAIAAKGNHNLALKDDGSVWAWGDNAYSQLGSTTPAIGVTPVKVSGLTDVTAIAAGYYHSLALKSDGTVWAWGRNLRGQLGNGTITDSATPVQVSGLTDVTSISAGLWHSLALKSDATVWAWGGNDSGVLGNGTSPPATYQSTQPVQVSNLTNVVSVSAGHIFNLALKADGTGWAWGNNSLGELGDGTTTNRNTPVQISGLTGIKGLSAGGFHSLALKADATVWVWGSGTTGQLGNGVLNTVGSTTPVQVPNLRGAVGIGTGYAHCVAAIAGLASLSPSSLTFGNQAVGVASTPQTITVLNTGSGTLDLAGASITGTNPGDFAVELPGAGQRFVAPGASASIKVTFTPGVTGNRSGVLVVYSNGLNSPQSVPLSGVGT
jgi:alpha-tubulin suppressor-like RCC1 family protein